MGQPFLNCTIAKTFSELFLGNSHDLSCEGDMTLVSFIVSFIYKEIAVTKCQTISTDHLYTLFKTIKLTLYYIVRVIVPRTLPLIYVCTNPLTKKCKVYLWCNSQQIKCIYILGFYNESLLKLVYYN